MFSVIYEVIYSDWFVYNMLEHLNAKDLYSLKMSTKFHYKEIKYKDIKNVIIKTVINRLESETNIKIDVLLNYMEKNKISISGSFILQCILNEFWADSDIDMYTYENANLAKNVFMDCGYEVSAFTTENDYAMLNEIRTIGNFDILGKPTIQLILLDNDKNIFTYVNTSYDFNVCKNIFYVENGKNMLHIQHIHNIMKKQISCNFLGTSCKLSARKLKYEGRGFTFKDNVLGNYVYYNGGIVPIVMCHSESKQINVFNNSIRVDGLDKDVVDDEWCFTDYGKLYNKEDTFTSSKYELNHKNLFSPIDNNHCNKIYENRPSTYICHSCPIKCLDSNIKHYHSKITMKSLKSESKFLNDSIVVEYSDSDILRLHKKIHEGEKVETKYKHLFVNFRKFCKQINYTKWDVVN